MKGITYSEQWALTSNITTSGCILRLFENFPLFLGHSFCSHPNLKEVFTKLLVSHFGTCSKGSDAVLVETNE